MESLQLRRNFSRNVIIRMLLAAIVVAALVIWKIDFVINVYFHNQLTSAGLIINSAILVLFATGLLRIVLGLVSYHSEEKALDSFMRNLKEDVDPLANIGDNKIIVHRYRTLHNLHRANTPINHSALATTLVASESTRNSFPKFINNILILCGVFGTIVSLSIALTGATDLLGSTASVDGMGVVVHGMSTALSTTITAIVCYLFFGYFYMKLTDAQTNLVSAIEEITATHLLPIFQVQTESILFEFSGLIR
ncbi:MAG: MotA/TolQ/ExbB proton channel family protein, partial [Sedimenticola sp.]